MNRTLAVLQILAAVAVFLAIMGLPFLVCGYLDLPDWAPIAFWPCVLLVGAAVADVVALAKRRKAGGS